jgi:hypothetical protein
MSDINQVITLGIGTPAGVPEFLTLGLQIGAAVAVPITPDDRIFTVAADGRIFAIDSDGRIMAIAQEKRVRVADG